MSKLIDLTAQRFGRLTVLSLAEDYISPKGRKRSKWLCQCDCGKKVVVIESNLKNGKTSSCGCLKRETAAAQTIKHGMGGTRLYRTWSGMKRRCLNPNHKSYSDYGGRGITVCNEWLHFEPFYEWAMANGYRDDLSIDRIDNDKGYCPENCRWVSDKAQANNRSTNRLLTLNGETHNITEWSEITGINRDTIRWRLKNGWTVEQALTMENKQQMERK